MEEDINKIIGKNLLKLRKNAKLTQLELAEKFNYSDKSISKWETGESLPNVETLYNLCEFYHVSLNDLTNVDLDAETAKNEKQPKPRRYPAKLVITLLAVSAVWLLATILFVILKLTLKVNIYMCFLWSVPISCIVLIVFNSLWGRFRYLFIILSVFLWSLLASIHVEILLVSNNNMWPFYILGIPLQIAIILWGALVQKPKKVKVEKIENLETSQPSEQDLNQMK